MWLRCIIYSNFWTVHKSQFWLPVAAAGCDVMAIITCNYNSTTVSLCYCMPSCKSIHSAIEPSGMFHCYQTHFHGVARVGLMHKNSLTYACGTWESEQMWLLPRCKVATNCPPIYPIWRPQGIHVWQAYEPQALYYNCALSVCQHYFSCVSKVTVSDPS